MEVIYPKACGVDVHKSFIVAVICDSTSVKPQYLRKRFSTFPNALIDFRNWLLANDCQNVCMESTGKYYKNCYCYIVLSVTSLSTRKYLERTGTKRKIKCDMSF